MAGSRGQDGLGVNAGLAYEWKLDGFRRGDTNGDGTVDVSDPVFALASLFVAGSPPPECEDAADANDDGELDIADPVQLLTMLFIPGALPLPPPIGCSFDPTPDALGRGALVSCF